MVACVRRARDTYLIISSRGRSAAAFQCCSKVSSPSAARGGDVLGLPGCFGGSGRDPDGRSQRFGRGEATHGLDRALGVERECAERVERGGDIWTESAAYLPREARRARCPRREVRHRGTERRARARTRPARGGTRSRVARAVQQRGRARPVHRRTVRRCAWRRRGHGARARSRAVDRWPRSRR